MATNLKQVADQLMADIITEIQNGEREVTYGGMLNCWLTVGGIKEVQVNYEGKLIVPLELQADVVKDIFDNLQEEMLDDRLKKAKEETERIEQEIKRRKQAKEESQKGDH